jgi:serine protease Do
MFMNKIFILLFSLSVLAFLLFSCNNNNKEIAKEKARLLDSIQQQKTIDSLKTINDKLSLIDSMNKVYLSNRDLSSGEVYEASKKAVITIHVSDTAYNNVQGSGFFINSTGVAVSNYHVFRDYHEGYVETAEGKSYRIEKILKADEVRDWVIFKVQPDGKTFNYLTLHNGVAAIGDKCFAIGSPKSYKLTISEGIISQMRENNEVIQTTTPFTHGSSGGPLFNGKGNVIGITTAIVHGEGNLNFAVNINVLKSSLKPYLPKATLVNKLTQTTSTNKEQLIKAYIAAEDSRNMYDITTKLSDAMSSYYDIANPTIAQIEKRYKYIWSISSNPTSENIRITKLSETTYAVTCDFTFYSLKTNSYKTLKDNKNFFVFDPYNKIVTISDKQP